MKLKVTIFLTLVSLISFGCKTREYNVGQDNNESEMLNLASEELVKKVVRYSNSNADNIVKAFNNGDSNLGLKLLEGSEGNSLHVLGLVSRRANAIEVLSKKIGFIESLPPSVQKDLPIVLTSLGEEVTRSSAVLGRLGYSFYAKRANDTASSILRNAMSEFKILSSSLKSTYGSVNNIDQYAASTVLGKFVTNSSETRALSAALRSGQKGNVMYAVYESVNEAQEIYQKAIKNAPSEFKTIANKQFNPSGTEFDVTGEFSLYQPFARKINNESLPRLTESMAVPSLDKGAALIHNDLEAAQRGINPVGFKKRALNDMVCLTEEFLGKASKIVKISGGASYARLSEQMLKNTFNAYKSVKVVNSGGKEFYQVGGKQFGSAIELNSFLAQSLR